MITVIDRSEIRLPNSPTARFVGDEHGAGISFFWVRTAPGDGTDLHRHPYTETWVVIAGRAAIEIAGERAEVGEGAIVTVPAESRHCFRSLGPDRLDMVCIHASSTIVQQFDEAEAAR